MDQLDFLRLVVELLESANLQYMVVESYASGYWGEPRSTYGLDVVVSLQASDLPRLEKLFPSERFYMSTRAALDAIVAQTQFNVIHPDSGNKVDFKIESSSAWGGQQLAHRRRVKFAPELEAWVGVPEYVIISKMLYYRDGGSDKHLRDISGMLKVSGDVTDCDYIAKWAHELDVMDIWQTILRRVGEVPHTP